MSRPPLCGRRPRSTSRSLPPMTRCCASYLVVGGHAATRRRRRELFGVGGGSENGAVTEDYSSYAVQKPRKRTGSEEIADFTMLVQVPGKPEALSVFTDAQAEEANRYAAEAGGSVVPLPLDPPSGYVVDAASGVLIPLVVVGSADVDESERADTAGD